MTPQTYRWTTQPCHQTQHYACVSDPVTGDWVISSASGTATLFLELYMFGGKMTACYRDVGVIAVGTKRGGETTIT